MAVVFKLNQAGLREILKSANVQADLKRRAEKIAATADQDAGLTDGFLAEVTVGSVRAHGQVFTATAEAMVAEAAHRTLTRAIDAGR